MLNKDIVKLIEAYAPPAYQESYDNSGWQVGEPDAPCTGVLIALDATLEVLEEAVKTGCNLIITHHPLIFGKLKKIVGAQLVDKFIIEAIRKGISLYSCHTNLDNMQYGVNNKISEKLGLVHTKILAPMNNVLYKLVSYVPIAQHDQVLQALWNAGAGTIGAYEECAFSSMGEGSFKPMHIASPTIGHAGGPREKVQEMRVEVLVPQHLKYSIVHVLQQAHPYEEVAYELIPLDNAHQHIGAGMYGQLPEAMSTSDFLQLVKTRLQASVIRYTNPATKEIKKVAVCGGSGSFLLSRAMAVNCDAFITADYKYHQFFEAESKIMIADIGHFESEQYTSEIFYDIIKDKFPNFAVRITTINTNPINYYF